MADGVSLQVFLSSPGDVAAERAAAREILGSLAKEAPFGGRLSLREVSWDDPENPAVLQAHLPPQQAIDRGLPRPADCDVVVVILWSRMGTPLLEHRQTPDDRRYWSGTAWECMDALEAADAHERGERDRAPTVLIYTRTESVLLDPVEPDFEERAGQRKRVQAFLDGFRDGSGALRRSVTTYESPKQFADLLTTHLRELAWRRLEVPAEAGSDLRISALDGYQRVVPLDGYEVIDDASRGVPVYTGGFRVDLELSHNGAGLEPITLRGMTLEVVEHAAGRIAEFGRQPEGAALNPAGTARAHEFRLTVLDGQPDRARWVIDPQTSAIEVARSRENMLDVRALDAQGSNVLKFAPDPDDVEVIRGSVIMRGDGMTTVRFAFVYSVGGQERVQHSLPVCVYNEE